MTIKNIFAVILTAYIVLNLRVIESKTMSTLSTGQ